MPSPHMASSHNSVDPTGSPPGVATRRPALSAELDDRLAGPMWCLTVVWMGLLAGGLQDLRGAPTLPSGTTNLYWWGMALLWPVYLGELVAHAALGSRHLRYNILYCLIPPLRLGSRDHATWTRIWFPGAAWQHVDRGLVRRVEKAISGPMVGFALLVLPLLAIEYKRAELNWEHEWLDFALETASSIIWLAFALELIVMVSIAWKKSRYLLEHWIDLLIVLLPMVEVMPALRLLRLGRLVSVTRMARVYRTRGVAMRAFRAFLLLDSVQRLLHLNPERRLEALRERLHEQYYEIEQIRCEMREIEERIAAEEVAEAEAEIAALEGEAVD